MARYNPKNKQHRKTLAKRIAKMLLSSGFSLEGSSRNEDVYQRAHRLPSGSAQIRVFTSAINGEMRTVGEDAIRVCAVYTDNAGQSRGLVKSTRINRTGDTDGITGRLLEAMRKTYKIAQKRANDPGFLALPVKPSKKRWVPRKKKAGSKRTSARSLNTAVKAATKKPSVALPSGLETVMGALSEVGPPAHEPGDLDGIPYLDDEPIPTFKVGDLVAGVAGQYHTYRSGAKGLVKAVADDAPGPLGRHNGPVVTVFWLDRMHAIGERARFLKHVAA